MPVVLSRWSAMVTIPRLARATKLAARSDPLAVGVLVVTTVMLGVVPVALAWLTRQILDTIVASHGTTASQAVILPTIALVVGTFALGAIPPAGVLAAANLRRAVSLFCQGTLFTAVNASPGIQTFENPQYLDRLRLAQDLGIGAPSQIVQQLLTVLQSGITMVGFIGVLLVLNPLLCVVVAGSALPGLRAELSLTKLRLTAQWTANRHNRRRFFYTMLQSDVQAAKEIRMFGFGDFLHGRMQGELRAMNRAEAGVDRRQLLIMTLSTGIAAAVAGAGLVYVVLETVKGLLPVGDVALYIAAAGGIQASLGGLFGSVGLVQQGLGLFDHLEKVITAAPDMAVPKTPRQAKALARALVFQNVWFRYDRTHPWVLKSFDLTIPASGSVALVGLNGAGKSTIVKLACRFYDPEQGAIYWDGVDLRELDPSSLRRHITATFQDYMCYDLTARENIALADIAQIENLALVEDAAELAEVHQQLHDLPQGYDTMLGRIFLAGQAEGVETGVRLSGGQWQRVALARALFRKQAGLLILDEPSGGLDPDAEYGLQVRLKQLRRGRTTLLVSHRLSSVRDADEIVVVADGAVRERGTHGELLARQGEYARLFELQARGFLDEVGTAVTRVLGTGG
ncbi:MAG: ABC transporter ATP-binding protein [Candidatus Dormiibacterota bacterium]